MNLIPPIGATGVYQLLAPFSSQLVSGAIYECMAVRTLTDIITLGLDPFTEYYEPNGISETIYKNHLAAKGCIVSLRSSSGKWVYVPSHYIQSYPNIGGIRYTGLILSANIGPVPDSLALGPVRQKITDVISEYLGVSTSVNVVAITDTKLIAQDVATSIEANRQANIANVRTDYSRYLEEKNKADALQVKLTELENYIAANIPPTP